MEYIVKLLAVSVFCLFPSFVVYCHDNAPDGKVKVASMKATASDPVFDEVELHLGQYKVFDFTETSDGSKPFGGKPYSIEYESRDTNEKPTAWRGKVEVEKNGVKQLNDQAVVFASEDSPSNIALRVIVDNATIYRCNIKMIGGQDKPGPSPYQAVINAAFALDKGTLDSAMANAMVFKAINSKITSFGKGSDVWNAIDVLYKQTPSLPQTRQVISKIIFDTTRVYYDVKLGKDERSVFKRMLKDIQSALEQCVVNPNPPGPQPPTPGPVAPTKLWVVIVEESGTPPSSRGAFFSDKALDQRIKDKGHKWRSFDQNVTGPDGGVPPDLAPYVERSKGKQLPYLFLVDQVTGKVHYENPLPATPAALVEQIGKVGG